MRVLLILLQTALALISSPSQGQTVSGVVPITGTAASPRFVRYEIAFAFDPNPTDTWFEIQPPAASPITDGQLAAWDTRSISDGVYMIRLRVYTDDSTTPVETIARGITVQNAIATPAPPLLTAPTPTLPYPPTPPLPNAPAPTAIPSSDLQPPKSTPAPTLDLSPYASAFCSGVYLALGIFIILGIYAALRDRIRRPIRRWIRRVLSDIRKP